MVTAGFIVVFAAAGGIITAGGRWLVTIFPYAGLVIGAAMVGLGVWILVTNRTFSILSAGPMTANRQQSLGNAFLFGIAYAVGSLSCTLPIFLVVVGTSLAGEGLLFSFGQFIGVCLRYGYDYLCRDNRGSPVSTGHGQVAATHDALHSSSECHVLDWGRCVPDLLLDIPGGSRFCRIDGEDESQAKVIF
jgi:hypothetical protein